MPFGSTTPVGTAPQPSLFIERTELLAELDAMDSAGVTLVCSPAGYGKTLLLSDWAVRGSVVETCWVTIASGDNDPRRLWGSVVAALARYTSLPVSTSIPSPLGWSADEQTTLVTRLADELRLLPNPVRLVLDDLEQLAEPGALHGLSIFLRDRPRQVHLVLVGRFDPPLGLNRLRGSAQLGEIRADRLRFTLVESTMLLDRAGLHLTPAQVECLYRHTGGQAAALRLAATAISDAPDPDRFIAGFSRDERCAADYLTGEVIDHLPPDTLAFLRAISVADPISSELAESLSGRPDAGTLLNSLEHDTSLLSAVGGPRDTYRLEPLLRTYLLADWHRHTGRNGRELAEDLVTRSVTRTPCNGRSGVA